MIDCANCGREIEPDEDGRATGQGDDLCSECAVDAGQFDEGWEMAGDWS
jgi:hypothetical protein